MNTVPSLSHPITQLGPSMVSIRRLRFISSERVTVACAARLSSPSAGVITSL